MTVVLLNLGIYQSAQRSLVEERWRQLATATDARRDQLRFILQSQERQVRFVADQGQLIDAAGRGWTPAGRLAAEQALDRALSISHFHHMLVISAQGGLVAGAGETADLANDREVELARRAIARESFLADLQVERDGTRSIEMAVPIAAPDTRPSSVLIAGDRADRMLSPILTGGIGLDIEARAYLVRQDAGQVVYLTAVEPTGSASPPAPVAMSEPSVRAAALAASGVESSLELVDARGRQVCAITRHLPEIGWGLVGELDRDVMMAAMRGTVTRLTLIDAMILFGALMVGWIWRRRLAQHEELVTHRHAARVQAIFDTAFDAIITFDSQGRVRTVNRAAEALFGRSGAEMDGQPLHRFLRWSTGQDRTSGQALPTPGVVIVAQALRADGRKFPAEFSLGQAGEGQELLYTAIVRDIRERVEAERRIREFAEGLEASNRRLEEVNVQLEEASRLKSEFLANTSHELRTPLNGMIGFLQLVLDGMCESREEERDFTRQALQCSRHLLGLINDVLDIAKIESGKLTLEIEKAEVENLFQEVHTVTHVQAAQRGIKLHFEYPPAETPSVRCDFAKTKQVLINLIGNSVKFTHKGSITVRATPHPKVGHYIFDVIDTGIGIPKNQQKVIFEKFSQGDGSTTRRYGGTGLGLAISRSLVEVMGGVIGVDSEGEGKGTRMYFSLPIWQEQESVTDEKASDQIEGPAGGALVLVVEDDPVFRTFIAAVLHEHGYRTVEAAHAESGWLLVRRLNPAIVVLDYALTCSQGANLRTGWDLAERMTTDPDTRRIPLVFVTGFELDLREKLLSTTFARKPAHLMKPVEASHLVAKIDELVGVIESRQVRILIADDDPSVAAFIRKILPESRFHLEFTSNGEECLHALRTQPRGFDLLVLDLMMPGVSGYDVLREMTLTGTAASLPVLVLTNYPEARNAEERRLLEHGLVLDVLAKTAIHDNPALLPHILDWHLQVEGEKREAA